MEIINTKTGMMVVCRNEFGKIMKVYRGPVAVRISLKMFNPLILN